MDGIFLLFVYLLGFLIFDLTGIICHELGHLICGKISGWRFLSFRVFSLLWTADNGKAALKKSDEMKGIALGQCMLRPVDNFKDFRFVLYNLGGVLANAVLFGVSLALCVLLRRNDTFFWFFLGGVPANFILAIVSFTPMEAGGVPNDGKNVVLALRSEEAANAFWRMFKYNAEVVDGKRPRDFDEKFFELSPDADMSNYLIAYIRVLEAERLLDLGCPDEAMAVYQSLPLEKMPMYYRNAVLAEMLFYYSACERDDDKAKEIYSRKKMKEYLNRIRQPSIIRSLAAYRFFIENNREEGQKALADAKTANEHFTYPGLAAAEADRLAFLEKKFSEALIKEG